MNVYIYICAHVQICMQKYILDYISLFYTAYMYINIYIYSKYSLRIQTLAEKTLKKTDQTLRTPSLRVLGFTNIYEICCVKNGVYIFIYTYMWVGMCTKSYIAF